MDLIWYRGRTNKASFQAKQDGAALDLSGATLKFAVKLDPASTITNITKTLGNGITLTSTITGVGVVTSVPADTSSFANLKTILHYELQATLSNGEYYAFDVGRIILMPVIV